MGREYQRILLTHDRNTMPHFAQQRIAAGQPTPGVMIVRDQWVPGLVIEEILTIVFASTAEEWADRVSYVPM